MTVSDNIPNEVPSEVKANESVDIDQKAKKEDELLNARTKSKSEDIERQSDLKNHIHKIVKSGISIASIIYLMVICVWLYHLISPEQYHFTSEDNYNTLKNLLFGSMMGGLINHVARKMLSDRLSDI